MRHKTLDYCNSTHKPILNLITKLGIDMDLQELITLLVNNKISKPENQWQIGYNDAVDDNISLVIDYWDRHDKDNSVPQKAEEGSWYD